MNGRGRGTVRVVRGCGALALAALAGLAAGACGESTGTLTLGSLEQAQCDRFCAVEVRAWVTDPSGSVLMEAEVPCGAGAVSLAGLPHGDELTVDMEIVNGAAEVVLAGQETIAFQPGTQTVSIDLDVVAGRQPTLAVTDPTPRVFPAGRAIAIQVGGAAESAALLADGEPVDLADIVRDGDVWSLSIDYGWPGAALTVASCGYVSEPVVVTPHMVRVESSALVISPAADLKWGGGGTHASSCEREATPQAVQSLAPLDKLESAAVAVLFSCIDEGRKGPTLTFLCDRRSSVAYLDGLACTVLNSHVSNDCPRSLSFSADQILVAERLIGVAGNGVRVRIAPGGGQPLELPPEAGREWMIAAGNGSKIIGLERGGDPVHDRLVDVGRLDDGAALVSVRTAELNLPIGLGVTAMVDDLLVLHDAVAGGVSLYGYSAESQGIALGPSAGACVPEGCAAVSAVAPERSFDPTLQRWRLDRFALVCDDGGAHRVSIHTMTDGEPDCPAQSGFEIATPKAVFFDPSGTELWVASSTSVRAYRISDGAGLGGFTDIDGGATDQILAAPVWGTGSTLLVRSVDNRFTRIVGDAGDVACQAHPTVPQWTPWELEATP